MRVGGPAGLLFWLLAPACSGPASPSVSSPVTPALAITAASPSSLAGGPADLATCLRSSSDSSCLARVRLGAAATGAAATAPAAPGTPTATVTGGSVSLAWSAPTSGDPVVTYVLEAGSSAGASNLANFPTNSTATTFATTAVAAGTYYVRVRAQNAAGLGPASG